MTSIAESLSIAEAALATSGVAEPRREAISLITLATRKDKSFVYARPEYELTSDELSTFHSFVQRRSAREPLQYISGLQEFYGLDFEVTTDVLIPRPETEMVVERAIDLLRGSESARFCDVGTGSGCIAIAILHELPYVHAVALDVSTNALQIAQRNAERHKVSGRLKLMESDVFGSLAAEEFDLIVSNPPYVPRQDMDGLQPEVRDHEPHLALTDGSDGLSIVRRIVAEAPRFLVSGGNLVLEIGFDQSNRVVEMFDSAVWRTSELFPDLQGIPRLVSARLI